MEPNSEDERDEAGTDPLLDEQAGKGYGVGDPEQDEASENAPSPGDE